MSDTKVTNEGLPINNVTKDTPIEKVQEAVGETARILREKHGVHPLDAYREAHRRANERMGDKLMPIDMGDIR